MRRLTKGLCWQDNDPGKPVGQMVLEAADAYRNKHGVRPDTCLCHRSLADGPFSVDGVTVVPTYPLIHHVLIGVAEKQCTTELPSNQARP